MDLKKYISEIPDFPKKWINFKDMSPILENPEALEFVINSFEIANAWKIDKIVGLDARGFIFWSILAYKMKIPFIMLRKAGKLPWICESISYDLEYWSNTFEIQKNAIKSWDKIAIVDDLLATWWSAKAAIDLVEKLGGIVESLNFVIELDFLNWREKFGDRKVVSLVKYF
jgi:adenine phosphoribosyltransferase